MKLTYGQVEEILFEYSLETEGIVFTMIEEGEWEQDSKSQYKDFVFSDGEKFFRATVGRSGSPFTDWTYDSEIYGRESLFDSIVEVEKVEVVVTKWIEVK